MKSSPCRSSFADRVSRTPQVESNTRQGCRNSQQASQSETNAILQISRVRCLTWTAARQYEMTTVSFPRGSRKYKILIDTRFSDFGGFLKIFDPI